MQLFLMIWKQAYVVVENQHETDLTKLKFNCFPIIDVPNEEYKNKYKIHSLLTWSIQPLLPLLLTRKPLLLRGPLKVKRVKHSKGSYNTCALESNVVSQPYGVPVLIVSTLMYLLQVMKG